MSSSGYRFQALLVLGGVLLLAGCGLPGAPQPPSLQVPRPVDDLTATRKGDQVLLTWTPTTLTTDGENIRHVGTTDVCRGVNDFPMTRCRDLLASLKDAQVAHWTKGTLPTRQDYVDTLPAALEQQFPLGEATYAVEDLNRNGSSAGFSNEIRVPLAPTLTPSSNLKAAVTAEGVALSWTGTPPRVTNPALHYIYRIFRKNLTDAKLPEMIVGEVPITADTFLDRNIQWEQRYAYHVAAITKVEQPGKEPVEVEGDDSEMVDVFTHDIFPPAVPSGLQAVYSGPGQKPFIDLTWAPDMDADLAGYNVYRQEQGTAPVKINSEVVKTPSYRDTNVAPGHSYFYSVSAVDVRGNESARSKKTSERVPE